MLNYYWVKIQERISKIRYPYNIFVTLIFILLFLIYVINLDSINTYIGIYHDNLNFLFIIMLLVIIFVVVLYTFKCFYKNIHKVFKTLMVIALFSIIFIAAFYTYAFFHLPQPPEDKLVVAISPFYFTDESGKHGSDINTAIDFKEKLEATTNIEIKIIMLDKPVLDTESAKSEGQKVGAHLVIYGETKSKIGNRGEIKYYILPLPIISETMPLMPPSEINNLEGQKSFSMVTEEPITIVESLTENASSTIYIIGGLENYKKSNFSSAINFFKSVKNYENNPTILFYIANSYSFNNNLNESLKYLDKALEINPQDAEVWNNKGANLVDLGRSEDALAASNKALEINPQYAEAWYNKGLILNILGREEEAKMAFENANKLDPKFVVPSLPANSTNKS